MDYDMNDPNMHEQYMKDRHPGYDSYGKATSDATSTNSLANYKQQQNLNKAQAQFTKDSTDMEAAGLKYGKDWGKALPIPSQKTRDSLK